jgi:acyl-homoserine-lactone acylase
MMRLTQRAGIAAVGLLLLVATVPSFTAEQAEILWDRYGVPHIYAADRESMFYAHGWAQMRNHADLLLRLYGESRGRAAEYWGGDENLELDRWVHLNGVPERARSWYDAQDPQFRKYLDEFARGINDFAAKNPGGVSAEYRVVLPVTGLDVVQHPLRAVHYGYMGSRARMMNEVNAFLKRQSAAAAGAQWKPGSYEAQLKLSPTNEATRLSTEDQRDEMEAGSNTWAIGPARSATGNAMLIINPHLSWGHTFYRYMQVHLVGPDFDQVGAPQVGFPVAVVGFNRNTGWGRTVNTIDTVDFFRLTVKEGQYLFDGSLRPFERDTRTIKAKQPDGSLGEERIDIRRSVHGPVVYDQNGVTVAMRVAGLDRPKMLEQWFRMGEARTLQEFQSALRMMSVPMWHANYADDRGHIMFVFDGLVPRRRQHDFQYWSGIVPGDTSETLWTDYLSFDEMPKSIDPASGWHQNANEPPWMMTLPPVDRSKYPAYVAPTGEALPQMRTLRSLRMITEGPKITYDALIAKKHSTRMELADKVLPDLLKAAAGTDAAGVLAKWDRETNVDSQGAVLFQMFVDRYFSPASGGMASKLRVPYDPARPLDSAYGLADPASAAAALAAAADECRKLYGALDVKWGDVFRFASGRADLPGNGGPGGSGLFRTIAFTRRQGNKFYAASGETIVCAIEFRRNQRAQCLLGYGNATQPGSPHLEDQLPLMVQKKLLPVRRDKKEIEGDLKLRERF